MLVVQLLLPRFLVVEIVLFIHFVHGQALRVRSGIGWNNIANDTDEFSLEKNMNNNFTSCLIPVNEGSIKWEPLFLTTDGDIILPTKIGDSKVISIQPNQDVLISCPSARVYSSINENKNVMKLTCLGTKLQDPKTKHVVSSFNDLTCSRSVREFVQITGRSCGPSSSNGKIVEIGWRTNNKIFDFNSQITVCHDIQREHTFYTNHTIFGANSNARRSGKYKGSVNFKEGGSKFYVQSSAQNVYKKSSQRSEILSKYNIQQNNYLSKGHLAPSADFIYGEMQDASYYYFNTAPQWQKFNNGNWANVENSVRKYAMKHNKNLKVQTGTFQILQLSSISNSKKDTEDEKFSNVALGKNSNIPVPLYFWKLVFNPDQNQAIAFIGINHPILKDIDGIPIKYDLCPSESESLCEDMGWKFRNRNKAKKGLLYCCSYQSLRLKIPWILNFSNQSQTQDANNDNTIGLLNFKNV